MNTHRLSVRILNINVSWQYRFPGVLDNLTPPSVSKCVSTSSLVPKPFTSSLVPKPFQCAEERKGIRESRWRWCRRTIYAIIKQKPYNFTTNMLKAYLSAHSSSLSAFIISKTHIVAQKPCRRQLKAKVCSSKSAISLFFFLLSFCLVFTMILA